MGVALWTAIVTSVGRSGVPSNAADGDWTSITEPALSGVEEGQREKGDSCWCCSGLRPSASEKPKGDDDETVWTGENMSATGENMSATGAAFPGTRGSESSKTISERTEGQRSQTKRPS